MSAEPITVILPLDLGAATQYDQSVFPLAYHNGRNSTVTEGSLLLYSTLEEMVKIRELGNNLSDSDEFLLNTRIKYEALAVKKEKLQKNLKTLNPFKAFLNYRAARMFHAAALALYLETKKTSERMRRQQNCTVQTVPSAEMHAVNNAVPADAIIGGIAITLPGALDDDAVRTIAEATNTITSYASDPFVDDPHIRQLDDDDEAMSLADTASLLSQYGSGIDGSNQTLNTTSNPRADTTSPSSPQAVNLFHIDMRNAIVATSSSFNGLTVNRNSQNSQGASVSQKPTP